MIPFLLYLSSTCLLAGVFIQDWKFRAIHWALIPSSIVLFLAINIYEHSFDEHLAFNVLLNLVFITSQFIIAWGYFRLRHQGISFIDQAIGKGDIYFIFATGFRFMLPEFIFYYVSALMFSLLTHLVVQRFSSHKNIPLAGYMAVWMGVFPLALPWISHIF